MTSAGTRAAEVSSRQPSAAGTSGLAEPAPGAGNGKLLGRLKSEPVVHLLALLAVIAAVVALVLSANKYNRESDDANIVKLELGGRNSARDLVGTTAARDAARTALHWDFLLIAGYGSALFIGGFLALAVMRTKAVRRWVRFGLFAAAVTVLADCLENLLLMRALSGSATLLRLNCYDAASVFAVVKFCAFAPAAATAALGLGVTGVRAFTYQARNETLDAGEYSRPLPVLCSDPGEHEQPSADDDGRLARWVRGYQLPPCAHAGPARGAEVTGIGLSGGGVRAASVALGVLQAKRFREEVVPQAQYLVSVSGGGYTAGAFAQALTNATPPPATRSEGPDGSTAARAHAGHEEHPPDEVMRDIASSAFMVGSPEEDHIRRHSSYIANTPGQMLTALGLLAGHLLMTLTLLFGPAILLGIAAGVFYRRVPLTGFRWTEAKFPTDQTGHLAPLVRGGALWALAIIAGLTLLCLLAVQFFPAHSNHPGMARRIIIAASEALLGLTAVIALLTVVLPRIMWLSSWLLDGTRGRLQIASPIAGVLLTYLASLAALAWRKRSLLTKTTRRTGTLRTIAPRGLMQIVLAITALIVLVLGWLLVVGGMASVGYSGPLNATDRDLVLGLMAALVLLGGLTDETTLSLHPFYRARLASAFAVRRVRRSTDGQIVAEPYPPTEATSLSRYAAMAEGTAFPHVIFAASATLGAERTPPGSDRVSYTFCADWVGGPDVGYVDTAKLEKLVPPRLSRDLTVQGAVALSGAAIAASVGGQGSAWYDPLFVVSGARLGAWMPNPTFMIEQYRTPATLARPGLPRARRINYLLRELFGFHAVDGPLLQVTDGGFYDNLGLLELFRRGCTRIYCVDASGDTPPAATTLARVLTRAYQELGVEADLDENTWSTATAGSGEKLMPADPLAALSQRLSGSGVITGKFSYPACGPYAGRTGTLVVAKASLWFSLPYKLMAYAHNATVFPHDSTADQWFDDQQYAAYTELGRCLGESAVAAMATAVGSDKPAPTAETPAAVGTVVTGATTGPATVGVGAVGAGAVVVGTAGATTSAAVVGSTTTEVATTGDPTTGATTVTTASAKGPQVSEVLNPVEILGGTSPVSPNRNRGDHRHGFEFTFRWRA